MNIVILAAGKGLRFGAIKQFTPVKPDGSTLLEVTLADARRAGCNHAVIVTSPGNENDVRTLFKTRPLAGYEITIVTQCPEDMPTTPPITRSKPWGTAHALWTARNALQGPFLLFNADDYYGPNASRVLTETLAQNGPTPGFAMLGYPLSTTLSPSGTVSRAICETDGSGLLTALHEYPVIEANGRIAQGANSGKTLSLQAPVSMNAWAFTLDVFPFLETYLRNFLAQGNLEIDECYLPAAIDEAVHSGKIQVRVVTAPDRWCGMTWPEDHKRVTQHLGELEVLKQAAKGFNLGLPQTVPIPFGKGLINTIWSLNTPDGPRLLQRLNPDVFTDPIAIAENAKTVSTRIHNALFHLGDRDQRHRLVYIDGPDGRPWLRDDGGDIWRCLVQVPHSRPADPASTAEAHAAAQSLGRFPGLVADGKGANPKEVFPGFHDTPTRLATLRSVAKTDPCKRATSCRNELKRLLELAPLADRLESHGLPIRFVHNDAKLDNVLVDTNSGEALCVIDLDTTMPGLAPHDFGDLIRTSITGRPEDEPDLQQVVLRSEVFTTLATGYLAGAHPWITDAEKSRLVDGTLVITYEQAMRFLTDHLAGDIYYHTDMAGHNLQRTRAQLRLLEELLAAENTLRQIINTI